MIHECPRWQQSWKLATFSIKVTWSRSLTLVSIERVSLVEYAWQIWSLSLTVHKLWPRLKFFCHRVTDRHDKNYIDAPEFHSGDIKTRAPRGTDRSPEYNEHFCYMLDSRVKNLTMEWNRKQQHFIRHASRLLLWIQFVAVAFRSEEEVFFKKGTPRPILPRPGSAPGQIRPKHLHACAGPWALQPYQVS